MKKEEQCEKKLEEKKEKIEELKEEIKECDKDKKEIEKELEDYKKKSEEYYEQLLRLKAEFENYRKRVDKEKHDLIAWGKYDFMKHLLPLYEMMNMAKNHLENSSSYEDIKVGLNMIFAEFDKLFKNQGVSEVDALNKKYDPMTCEIIGTVEGNDENDGNVVEVVQPGYMINGKLLKAARVKVAKKKEETQDKSKENDKKEESEKNNS
ncbi:MAG: nucleotide exchange factor GrpE [Elusimicrobiales bacterium]|nr:nucleotide exchange factor GrpE [Elusimicrobiales bacterium]